jgi:hypothetical protein
MLAPVKADILDLLSEFRRYEATDDRDKMFALTGLTEFNIVPDYKRTVEWAFQDASRKILEKLLHEQETKNKDVSQSLFGVLYLADSKPTARLAILGSGLELQIRHAASAA